MRVMRTICVGLCMLLTSAAVGATAATKPDVSKKPSVSGSGSATIYFLRPTPIAAWATKPDIKLDGRLVGEISAGTYFVTTARRGQHTISIQGGLDGGYDSDLQVEAGKTYFLEVGRNQSYQPIGQQLIGRIINNNTWGQPLPGRGFMGAYVFYQLSDQDGRTKIATLKKITR
jgi:hypothetical protein